MLYIGRTISIYVSPMFYICRTVYTVSIQCSTYVERFRVVQAQRSTYVELLKRFRSPCSTYAERFRFVIAQRSTYVERFICFGPHVPHIQNGFALR